MAGQGDNVYTLHYFPFSLYSLMVRFGIVLGERLNPSTAPKIEIKLVNLHRGENISEEYLALVNSKGQVPTLTSPSLPLPLTESRDISRWLCEKQSELIPQQHEDDIKRLMDKIYKFHAQGLTVNADDRRHGIPNQAAALLEKSKLSDKYRRALEIKSIFHDTFYGKTLEPENVHLVEEQARDFMQDLEQVLNEHSQQGKAWIFGDQPTILDAHTTALVVRLLDRERIDLLPERVREYGNAARATEEWRRVTHGRRTMWDVSLGHVANLDPL